MSTIYCKIRGQELNLSIPAPVVGNSIDYINVNAMFSSEWENTVKFIFFFKDNRTLKIIMENSENYPLTAFCENENINLDPGRWKVWIMGDVYNDGAIKHRITTNVVEFTVLESGVIDNNIVNVPPDVGEQILGVAIKALEQARKTDERMSDLEYRANSGEFDGKQGEQGRPGEQGIQGVSGVYVGSGEIPAGFNVKINPAGTADIILEDAPADNNQYARKNKAWEIVQGGGGGSSNELWKPTVDSSGNISWQKSTSSTPPTTQNIKGTQGTPGTNGTDGVDGKSAYESAQDGGYTGTEAQFNSDLADVSEKIGEAPNDGQQYARKNKAWAVVQGGGSGGAVIDDTAGAGDTDKAWSANKLTNELAGKLSTSGGTMTGDIRLNGARLYFIDTLNMVLDGTSFIGMSSTYFNFGIKTKVARLRGSAVRPTYLRGDEASTSELALLSDVSGKIDEAPNDGQQYVRKNRAWAVMQGGGTSSPWSGKNVLVLGDSGSDTATYHNNWWNKLASELGFNTPTVKAYPGSGITTIVGNCTVSDVTGKDLIIIEAGANDKETPLGKVGDLYPTQSTICGKVKYAIETIYTLLSSANNLKCRVMFFAPYCFGTDQNGHDGYYYDINGLSQAIEDTANYDGIPCYNAYKESGINSHTWGVYTASASDHVHLNLSGNALIGKSICQFIKNKVLPYEQVNG